MTRLERRCGAHGFGGLHTFQLPGCTDQTTDRSITLRLADCDGERSNASMLVNRKYSRRGYGRGHGLPATANCVTFTASSGSTVVGTLSLTVDSPEGLASDRTFKDELDRFRAVEGTKICELTKFAFDTSTPSLHLLASLFHIIFIYGTHRYNCTDLFIEVNPRHRRFYEAMLGFKPVGSMKTNDAVGAPSHLMWLKVSEIRRRIDDLAGGKGGSSHSLYPYFFSKQEELAIYNRLVGQDLGERRVPDSNRVPDRRRHAPPRRTVPAQTPHGDPAQRELEAALA